MKGKAMLLFYHHISRSQNMHWASFPNILVYLKKAEKKFFLNVKFFCSVEKKFYTKILHCKVSQHRTNTKKSILFYIVTIQNQKLKMKQFHQKE